MLIEAPCRLGERFTHNRSYSNPKEQYLVGIDLFVWHCNIDGVTLMGSPNKKGRVDFFERKYMDALPISFEVPDRLREMVLADVLMEGVREAGSYEETWALWHYTWDSTIGPGERLLYGWNANPWVWVISFERVDRPEPST